METLGEHPHKSTEPDDYYHRLQRYSVLYRILLARPYATHITLNTWHRIDLKLVNELGLTLTGKQRSDCWLQVDCQLLIERQGLIRFCADCHISCRPLQHNAWEMTASSDIAGFQSDTDGHLEYKITMRDEGLGLSPSNAQTKYFLRICPTDKEQQTVKAFPLVIGPLYTIEDKVANMPTKEDDMWKEPSLSQDVFHGYSLQDDSFLVIKEDWKLGTPGKMWDSALVLSQLLCDKVHQDPTCFKGKRLLDLSAGTGCLGLLLASLYKNIYHGANMPDIIMTDLQEALDLILQNRAYNYLSNYTTVKQLEWGNLQDVQDVLIDGPIDTIIASDVLYKPSSFPKLVQTLDWLSAENRHIDIYLGYKRRGLSMEDEQSFFDICARRFDIHHLSSHISSSFSLFKPYQQRDVQLDICKEIGVNIYQLVRK